MSEFIENDQFAKACGIEVLQAEGGTAKVQMELKSEHLNGAQMAHGGLIFTLADVAFAAAANSREGLAVAINANISFLKAAKEGLLTATAKEVSLGKRLASYSIDVTDEKDVLIATFQGMVYRRS